jgi:protein LSM14
MGNHLMHRRARGTTSDGGPEGTEGEYDFEATLGNFNKEEAMQSIGDERLAAAPQSGPAYSKSSFFDEISCDALDRANGTDTRLRAADERKLNTATFGAISLNDNRHRWRGGGKGEKGGGGGKGDGGKGKGGGGGGGKGDGNANGRRRGGRGRSNGSGPGKGGKGGGVQQRAN